MTIVLTLSSILAALLISAVATLLWYFIHPSGSRPVQRAWIAQWAFGFLLLALWVSIHFNG